MRMDATPWGTVQQANDNRHNKIEDESSEARVQSHERVAATQDEKHNRDDSHDEPGENSGLVCAAPEEPEDNAGEELRNARIPN